MCELDDDEKLLRMFTKVHDIPQGVDRTGCYPELTRNANGDPTGVALMKGGNYCWSTSKADLLFDYVTKDWS